MTIVPPTGRDTAYARGSLSDRGAQSCALCLRANQPMTREHVFARWLVRQVHGGDSSRLTRPQERRRHRFPPRVSGA